MILYAMLPAQKNYPNFVLVKKAIAVMLMPVYLLGTTEAYQALKLPILVRHYILRDALLNFSAFPHSVFQPPRAHGHLLIMAG